MEDQILRIPAVSDAMRSMSRVNEKHDADADARKERREQEQRQKNDDNLPTEFVTDEKVDQAIQSFSQEVQNRANGLTADKIGHGPGLKVVLRDGTGAVIRQFTGEEFLKVREAVANRGRILDQKL
jgi:hypothetical protein